MKNPGAGDSERRLRPPHYRELLAMLVLVLASFVFTSDQVGEHEMMSPIDEYQYVGYYSVVADRGIVRQGEEMPLFAKRYMMCHGVRAIPEMPVNPAACEAPKSVGYPIEGGTTADLYTPLYFTITRALAQPLIWAGVDFVDAGRAVGGFWLSLGAVFLYLALRRTRSPIPVALGLSLVVVGSLPAYWGNTYISTDATALAAGAIAAWLTMRALDGVRGSLVLLPVAAMIATALKLQNLMGFAVAAVVLLLSALLEAHRKEGSAGLKARAFIADRRSIAAIATVAAAIIAQGVWLTIRSSMAVGPQPKFGFAVPLEAKHLVVELGNFLPQLGMGALGVYATGPASYPVYMITAGLAIGGCVGLALSKGIAVNERLVGAATVLVAVLAAPALALAVGAVEHNYVPLPTRYGASLLPWALLSAGILVDTKRTWMRYLILSLGVLAWAIALMMGEG